MNLSSSKKIHIEALDGWRGIACLMVFFWHLGINFHLGSLIIYGSAGVHLFFVLSGYLLYRPFIKKLLSENSFPGFYNFYLRRFFRIYPPYLVALIVFIFLRYWTKVKPPDYLNISAHIILLLNYLGSESFFSINPVFWSLAVEAQFYILLPIFTWVGYKLATKEPQKGLFLTVILMLSLGIIFRGTEFLLSNDVSLDFPNSVRFRSIFSFLDLFGFGMLVAYLEYFLWKNNFIEKYKKYGNFICTLGILLFISANAWFSSRASNWMLTTELGITTLYPVFSCFAISVILLSIMVEKNYIKEILSFKPLVLIGKISYSLYLYHIGVQLFVLRYVTFESLKDVATQFYLQSIISLVVTIIVSLVMYKIVEEPSLALVERFRV